MPRPKLISDDAVLAAALDVMCRRGPTRFTLREVAKRSGLSPAALIQRFGSKAKLVRRALATSKTHLLAPPSTPSPLAVWLGALAGKFATAEALADNLLLLRRDMIDPRMNRTARDYFATLRERIATDLRTDARAGRLIAHDSDAWAQVIEAQWNGAIIQWAIHQEGRLDHWVQRSIEQLLRPLSNIGRIETSPEPLARRPGLSECANISETIRHS